MRAVHSTPLLFLVVLAGTASADDGMWMPEQIPLLAPELRELGLEIDPAAFADLTGFPMGAVVSLGGCSAAFVSADGLIVTNHHCVYGALQYNSTPERDLIVHGFLARRRTDELQATPSSRVYVTTAVEDVTAAVTGDMKKGISDYDRALLMERRTRQLVQECESQEGVRCQVLPFFGGERFLKLTSLRIRDVRLVYAPPLGIGNFGDEEDNWVWPRHTGDFGFLRAYVGPDGKPADFSPDNVPYHPRHVLKISTRDLDPGDLILLAGYPGKTSRLVTADEVREAQEFDLPATNGYRQALLDILRQQGERGRGVEIANATRISGLENYFKKTNGVLAAMERDHVLEHKREDEKEIEARLAGDRRRAREYAAAQKELARLLERQRTTRERDLLYGWLYSSSPLLAQADLLYRLSVERGKSDDLERDDDFQERDWPNQRSTVRRQQKSIEPQSDRAGLRWFLLAAADLPKGQRIEAVDAALGNGHGPETRVDAFLDRLYAGTRLADLETRLAMFEDSTPALLARHDAMIDFASALRALGEANEERDRRLAGAMVRLRPVLIAAEREWRGGRLAPDANRTLRVGFGVVQGYEPRDGVFYEPQTTVAGVVAKSTGRPPFDSPADLLERAREGRFDPYIDPELGTLPVNFISTVNVTNGSSGSCALNARGEIAGLAFDSNWEGVGADWWVNERTVRTIHVDSRYMLWVMDAVDGAHNLLEEMGLPTQSRPQGKAR